MSACAWLLRCADACAAGALGIALLCGAVAIVDCMLARITGRDQSMRDAL